MILREAQPTLRSTIGRNMRIRRAELDISQEELAVRIKTSASNVSGIERGRRNTTVDVIEKIAAALDMEPAELLRPRSRQGGVNKETSEAKS